MRRIGRPSARQRFKALMKAFKASKYSVSIWTESGHGYADEDRQAGKEFEQVLAKAAATLSLDAARVAAPECPLAWQSDVD